MPKVLIISYYWPPAGGPGVQRVLKFVKYLRQFDWEPFVLTVKNGEFHAIDYSLARDIPEGIHVFKTSSIEPGSLYRKFVGINTRDSIDVAVLTEENPGWKKRISNWIRLNCFIPDAKIGWKPFAVHTGKKIIKQVHPDIIFSSSPPPTVHLIAQKLARWSGIKWVADFRDPWINIYHYHKAPKCRLAKRIDVRLENKVRQRADRIITVSEGFFKTHTSTPEYVISNGFDDDDYQPPPDKKFSHNHKKFTICYMGSLKARQYIDTFFNVLEDIQSKYPDKKPQITLKFIGRIPPFIESKIRKKNIDVEFEFAGYLDHHKALQDAAHADMLLLIIGKSHISKSILTGKLFEYLMLAKPILAYGPLKGAAHRVLMQTKSGEMFDYQDLSGPAEFIEKQIIRWRKGKTELPIDHFEIKKYSRKEQTRQLVEIFKELI
jgi:glycosyltransferase involved in cell wall biosynthesis